MNKIDMREWVASLEQVVDNKLNKWKKESRIENGEAVQIEWQFNQTHIIADVFWEDGNESVHLHYLNPRTTHRHDWNGLSNATFNKIIDRIGNWAQVTMYPIKDYME